MNAPTALIAEDEALLSEALQTELRSLWPELKIVARVYDGVSAVQAALAHRPLVVFMDIRMPGQSGIEAAQALAEDWPAGMPLPRIVFVSAHDEYALPAFEAAAIDYVLKPVRRERLARTVQRLQEALKTTPPRDEALFSALRHLESPPVEKFAPLQRLQASVGHQLRIVPMDDVILFEAADKHVRAITRQGEEFWLRTPLKELLLQIDDTVFWQIHRSTVVRADAMASASRDAQGQWQVLLQGLNQPFKVSRLFAYRFKPM